MEAKGRNSCGWPSHQETPVKSSDGTVSMNWHPLDKKPWAVSFARAKSVVKAMPSP